VCLEEIGRGRLIGPDAEQVTFDNLAEMLLHDYELNDRRSIPRAKTAIRHLRDSFGFHHALDTTTDAAHAHIRKRQEEGAAPSSIDKELKALARMLTLAVQAGKLPNRPYIPSIQVNNTRTHFVGETEFQAVCENLPPDVRSVAEFLFLTGWRVGEALQLTWPDVEFDAGMIRLRPGTTNNREAPIFPFAGLPELEALLGRQREYTDAVEKATGEVVRHVFHRNGKPIKTLRGAWKAACTKAGLPHFWIHDLRRSGVRRLIRSGVPQAIAMKITGHKTPATFRRYGIVTESDLTEAVQKVAEFRKKERAEDRQVIPLGHDLATIMPHNVASSDRGRRG